MSACTVRTLVVLAGALAAGAACAAGGGGTPTAATPASSGAPRAAAAADCWVGTHQVRSITGRQAVDTPLGPAKPAGSGGSLRLDLGGDGQWTLSSDGSRPVVFDVGGTTISGTVRGRYTHAGAQFAFEQGGADGSIVLSTAAGSRNVPISTLGPALAPGGSGTLTCQPDRVVLDTASVQMELAPAAGGAVAAAPATPTPAQQAPATSAPAAPAPASGPPLELSESARDATLACDGRPVSLQGSQNRIHLTCDCPRLEIVGSTNTVTVDRIDDITITGSFNKVTWTAGLRLAQPGLHSNGTGNTVQRG